MLLSGGSDSQLLVSPFVRRVPDGLGEERSKRGERRDFEVDSSGGDSREASIPPLNQDRHNSRSKRGGSQKLPRGGVCALDTAASVN